MKRWVIVIFFAALPALSQVNNGELRVTITDPLDHPVKTSFAITSTGNQYANSLSTDASGRVAVKILPYGLYVIRVEELGFSPVVRAVEVRSSIPAECNIRLAIAQVATMVNVEDSSTLIDPHNSSSIMQIGSKQIEERLISLPGRSVQDLVVSQPGWLYEGNAVLHPRGAEYQTQFVIDGIPLTDNRSPSFGPEVEADDVNSMSIYTAGFPAEYGRKMGGVVEINTKRETVAGVHGQLILSGGSYDTAAGFGHVQDVWGKNTLSGTASGSKTSHYLNPVVPENFTNKGTTGDFSVSYERDFTETDRVSATVRHEFSRFLIPNELLQQDAGQVQNGDNFEMLGAMGYQHIFSPAVLGNVVGMVRDNANNLYSNDDSTPIIAFQHNYFREGYFKGTVSAHHGNQEWKFGVESDATVLHEKFNYTITDPDQFDEGTPDKFSFAEQRSDLEQPAFVEDLIRLGEWTISAGLRWDHYQLLLNESAFSPRLSVGRYLPKADMVLHVAYDRVFETPSFENILLSSSPQVASLNPHFLRLPVKPSKGNYYEGGVVKGFSEKLRMGVNVYRRDVTNYADDDQLLNTGVSYPIAFDKAVIYGAEGKLDVVQWGKLTGFLSSSYMVGNAWFPVTGGLFLGDEIGNAETELTRHFPISQDQRNTLRTRFKYQLMPRLWIAGGLSFGSGLPFEYGGTQEMALAQYGPLMVDRLNFERRRVDPSLAVRASVGADLIKLEKCMTRIQVDGDNLK